MQSKSKSKTLQLKPKINKIVDHWKEEGNYLCCERHRRRSLLVSSRRDAAELPLPLSVPFCFSPFPSSTYPFAATYAGKPYPPQLLAATTSIGQRSFLPSLPVSLSAATSPAPTTAQPTAMLVPKVDQGSELLLLSLSSSAACLHAPASQFGGQAIIELATLEPN
ncbi:unnamed protein product [Citrullus colocynthis]|uniref:Uncharacterized protein n=1 Tax=Citrullus colocynthis TaxID=252529 RepID=A0ABP0XQG1_9ROSI